MREDLIIKFLRERRGSMSEKYTLDRKDIEKWGLNLLRFVIVPTVIAFLTAYQGGVDIKIAWGVALGTGYTSIVDLLRKFIAGK